jgi:hypothetical protein
MRKFLLLIAIMALVLTGCGRKEAPQPIINDAPPVIAKISHEVVGNSLKIELSLEGGSHGIGYQIDRTEIDPYCKCPGFWRRYHEATPKSENFGKSSLTQLIVLKGMDVEYAFRVRAIDALGRFSDWSQVIRARAEADLFR